MIAAIYARKSSKQERGGSGDAISIENQIAGASAFIIKKGWQVGPIFKDEETSGWDNSIVTRPSGKRLMDAVTSPRRSGIDILVVRNESRLGRAVIYTPADLYALITASVQVWYYEDGTQVEMRTAMEKFTNGSLKSLVSEGHSEAVSKGTRAKKLALARAGKFPGGQVARGYRRDGDGLAIDEVQAPLIRQLFEAVADGAGVRRAGQLVGLPATTVRAMLDNRTYIGAMEYVGRLPDGTLETVAIPCPAIIASDLWDAAHARMTATRQTFSGHRKATGHLTGRPISHSTGPHLLGGLLKCGHCGSSLVAVARGTLRSRKYYVCSGRYKLGRPCDFKHYLSLDRITDAILEPFSDRHEDVLRDLMEAEWRRLGVEQASHNGDAEQAQADLERLDAELARLIEMAAKGGQSVPALLAAIQAKQAARDVAAARLASAEPPHAIYTAGPQATTQDAYAIWSNWAQTPDGQAWQAVYDDIAEEFLGTLRATLERRGVDGHRMFKEMLPAPIQVRLAYQDELFLGWSYEGAADLGGLVAGFIAKKGRVTGLRPATKPGPTVYRLTLPLSGLIAA